MKLTVFEFDKDLNPIPEKHAVGAEDNGDIAVGSATGNGKRAESTGRMAGVRSHSASRALLQQGPPTTPLLGHQLQAYETLQRGGGTLRPPVPSSLTAGASTAAVPGGGGGGGIGGLGSLLRSRSFASSLSLRSAYDEGGMGSGGTLGRSAGQNKLIPHPERTCELFEATMDGLADCIEVTSEDIQAVETARAAPATRGSGSPLPPPSSSVDGDRSSRSGGSDGTESETGQPPELALVAARYLQRLRMQHAKIARLRERYLLQVRLRDGASEMGRAFVTSSLGRTREKALKGVRSKYRECEMTMKLIESQLETECLGSLHMHINAVQGFARVCPGDQFLITIRHGEKKWKSRGKVNKNGSQLWENRENVFKLSPWFDLRLKAVELKGLGRSVQLGERSCDVAKLMRAQAQMMNVKFGTSGSVQLELVVVWNPLHGAEEGNDITAKRDRPISSYGFGQGGLPPSPPSSGYASKSPVTPRIGTNSSMGSSCGVEDALEAFSFLDEQDDLDSGLGHSRNASPMLPSSGGYSYSHHITQSQTQKTQQPQQQQNQYQQQQKILQRSPRPVSEYLPMSRQNTLSSQPLKPLAVPQVVPPPPPPPPPPLPQQRIANNLPQQTNRGSRVYSTSVSAGSAGQTTYSNLSALTARQAEGWSSLSRPSHGQNTQIRAPLAVPPPRVPLLPGTQTPANNEEVQLRSKPAAQSAPTNIRNSAQPNLQQELQRHLLQRELKEHVTRHSLIEPYRREKQILNSFDSTVSYRL